MNKKAYGFTIVELLIVIVIIGILVAISIVAYNGIAQKARFANMRSDISSLNKAIQLYYADNGHYPVTENWLGFNQAKNDDFIPGLVPKYIAETPQLPEKNSRNDTFLYRSPNGTDYKLIRYFGEGLSAAEKTAMKDLMTTTCPSTNDSRWGYWSSDISKCW